MAIIINPIQLGKHSQASSSSSAGLKIATLVPPVARAATAVVPHVPKPMSGKRVVPFSCFQVVCNCLSLGWAFELFVFRMDFSNVDIYIYIERERDIKNYMSSVIYVIYYM